MPYNCLCSVSIPVIKEHITACTAVYTSHIRIALLFTSQSLSVNQVVQQFNLIHILINTKNAKRKFFVSSFSKLFLQTVLLAICIRAQ